MSSANIIQNSTIELGFFRSLSLNMPLVSSAYIISIIIIAVGRMRQDCLHIQYCFTVSLHTSRCSARDFHGLVSISRFFRFILIVYLICIVVHVMKVACMYGEVLVFEGYQPHSLVGLTVVLHRQEYIQTNVDH